MRFTRIELTNWKNFREAAVDLSNRAFLIGPNASGKSNFLDAFRFLHDVSAPGGIRQAVQQRGGIEKLRSLHARNPSDVRITVSLKDEDADTWRYELAFSQQGQKPRQGVTVIKSERVVHNGQIILSRPDAQDEDDKRLLEQTALEQNSRNRAFRDIADHFLKMTYLHLVPQIIRSSRGSSFEGALPDMYGGRFLELINNTPQKRREKLLKTIEQVLKQAVPQFSDLALTVDKRGVPHLEVRYSHWRPEGGKQNESQMSDGTLRLIGLLWMLQDGQGLMLMEEPELSLHQALVRQLAPFIHRAQGTRQTFISTHSVDLLSDPGIGAEEILLFTPEKEGTSITSAARHEQIRALMEGGLSAADAALPATHKNIQMPLLKV